MVEKTDIKNTTQEIQAEIKPAKTESILILIHNNLKSKIRIW